MPKKSLRDIDLSKFSERLHSESDRAGAILGAALLDARLEAMFRRYLRSFQDELLGADRPLGSFSARIRMASALALISDDVRADLDTIRSIRNDFAHSFDHELAFTDPSISDRCMNLVTARAYLEGVDIAAAAPHRNFSAEAAHAIRDTFKPARWRYQLSVEFLEQYLDQVATDVPTHTGSDLLAEVRALGAGTTMKDRGTMDGSGS